MSDIQIKDLTSVPSIATGDILHLQRLFTGTYRDRKITVNDLFQTPNTINGTNITGIQSSNILGGFSSSPSGLNTYVQFNDSGVFGGDAGLVYNKTTDTLSGVNFRAASFTGKYYGDGSALTGISGVSGGSGDMLKSIYDPNQDGIIGVLQGGLGVSITNDASKLAARGNIGASGPADVETLTNKTIVSQRITGSAGNALRVHIDDLEGSGVVELEDPAMDSYVVRTTVPSWAYAPVFQVSITYTGDHTLTTGNRYNYIRMDKTTSGNLTVPNNTTVPIPIDSEIPVRAVGSGQITFIAASGVSINTPETLHLRKQGSTALLKKVATNEWDLMGDLEGA